MISNKNVLTITGNSGVGKTATVRHIALQLRQKGYQVLSVDCASKITDYSNSQKQCFVFDDILGKFTLKKNLLDEWDRFLEEQYHIFETNNTILLCTLRNQVISKQDIPFEILRDSIIDFENHPLLYSEKVAMLKKHLAEKNLNNILSQSEIVSICQCSFAFPLMCKLFTTNEQYLLQKGFFFEKPYRILKDEMKKLRLSNNEVYYVLSVCMLVGGQINRDVLIKCPKKLKKEVKIKEIMDALCPLNVSQATLTSAVESVLDVYLVDKCNVISFLHDSLYEIVAYDFAMTYPRLFAKFCSFDIICNKVIVEDIELKSKDESVIAFHKSNYDSLATRFNNEIIAHNVVEVVMNSSMLSETFCKCFQNTFEKKKLEEVLNTKENSDDFSLLQIKRLDKRTTLIPLFDFNENVDISPRTVLECIVFRGLDKLFHLFWEELTVKARKRIICKYSIKPIIHFAVLGQNEFILKSLVASGADVNSQDEFGSPLLCRVAMIGDLNLASIILSSNKVDIDQYEESEKRTPLYIAVCRNNFALTAILLGNSASANICTRSGRSPLHEAVLNGNGKLAKLLTKHGANKMTFDEKGYSPFMIALQKNHKKIIMEFLKSIVSNTLHTANAINFTKQNIKACKNVEMQCGLSNLHLAVFEKDVMKLHRYICEGCDVNVRDVNGMSPLHFASFLNQIDCCKILFRNGANPNVQDNYGRTPFHFSSNSSFIEYLNRRKSVLCLKRNTLSDGFRCQISLPFRLLFNIDIPWKYSSCINVPDTHGNSPLHCAIRNSNGREKDETIRSLVRCGADIHLKNHSFETPLTLASEKEKKMLISEFKNDVVIKIPYAEIIICLVAIVFLCSSFIFFTSGFRSGYDEYARCKNTMNMTSNTEKKGTTYINLQCDRRINARIFRLIMYEIIMVVHVPSFMYYIYTFIRISVGKSFLLSMSKHLSRIFELFVLTLLHCVIPVCDLIFALYPNMYMNNYDVLRLPINLFQICFLPFIMYIFPNLASVRNITFISLFVSPLYNLLYIIAYLYSYNTCVRLKHSHYGFSEEIAVCIYQSNWQRYLTFLISIFLMVWFGKIIAIFLKSEKEYIVSFLGKKHTNDYIFFVIYSVFNTCICMFFYILHVEIYNSIRYILLLFQMIKYLFDQHSLKKLIHKNSRWQYNLFRRRKKRKIYDEFIVCKNILHKSQVI